MPLPPQKFREIVFQLLYSHDFSSAEEEENIFLLMEQLKVTKRSVLEAKERAEKVLAHLSEIDPKIQMHSSAYSFDRISRVEKTILRLGVFELLYDKSLPSKVVMAEAIRLCRKFATRESADFVNAIIDAIYQKDLHESSV